MPRVALTLPPAEVNLLSESPTLALVLPTQAVDLTCDDVIDDTTYVAPTLTSWTASAVDGGALSATVTAGAVTAGTPCRVQFKLVHASASSEYRLSYSSPEQNTPHVMSGGGSITPIGDRGLSYDLYWRFAVGMELSAWALVDTAVIYVPINGEGDYPASG